MGTGDFVAGPHAGKKGRRLKAGVLAHRGGKLPEQDGGHRVSLGIDGVIVLHMARCDGRAVPSPDAKRTGTKEDVHLLGELYAQGGIGDLPPEGGHPVAVLLMHLGGAQGSLQVHAPRFFAIISQRQALRKKCLRLPVLRKEPPVHLWNTGQEAVDINVKKPLHFAPRR